MLKSGILNPDINHFSVEFGIQLPVIADRGFPFWPTIETVDIHWWMIFRPCCKCSWRFRPDFVVGQVYMAQEFLTITPGHQAAVSAMPLTGYQ